MRAAAKDVFLISQDNNINWRITKCLVQKDYTISTSHSLAEGLGKIFEAPPAVIIVHEALVKGKAFKLLKSFKKDNLFSHIPLILLVDPRWEKQEVDWDQYPVEDYLVASFKPEELVNRVSLCVSRFNRALDPNPLTRLPGNTSILRQIQRALDFKNKVAVCYLDIDSFKAFNDKYGFARGDEALRMTARIISNVVQDYKQEEAFVGHVGGDDFVFIVPAQHLDTACGRVIKSFDAIIPSLYEEEDRKKGFIPSKDRKGKKQRFPLMSISIAVVLIDGAGSQKHYGEISETAMQLKKQLKKKSISNYMINRRRRA